MSILRPEQTRDLYNRIACSYDKLWLPYKLLGMDRKRKELVASLNLRAGETVVDLCCGTGFNFIHLAKAVGPAGKIIGVDVSEQVLARARNQLKPDILTSVDLVAESVENFKIPTGVSAVISTFGLEMVPEYDAVIENITDALPSAGRFGLLGLKYPEIWPAWLIDIGVRMNKPFGVSRDYKNLKPWVAAERHLETLEFKTLLFGSAYTCLMQKQI
ncbi:class I SAM-dependent methyltransferase [Litorimonas sp.]|uniref:class I SAM-dependent methyltransferase n=1 Tax=Litorimonas sp. TaxID=1892381 RepID=UPI003A88F07E